MVRPNLSTDGSGDGLMMLCTCHVYPPWLTFQTMFVRRSSRSSQSQAHLDFPNRRARIFHRLQCSAMRDIIKICFFISNLLELSTGSFECFFDGIRYVVLQLAMSFGLVSLGNVENIIFCACRKDCQQVRCARTGNRIVGDPLYRVSYSGTDFRLNLRPGICEKDARCCIG